MAQHNCSDHHRNRVLPVTDKASILYYTVNSPDARAPRISDPERPEQAGGPVL
jgi:hypothetical protein